MSSLALLEADIPSPLYVEGKNKVEVFCGVDGGCCCLSFMFGCGGSDGGLGWCHFNLEVGIG